MKIVEMKNIEKNNMKAIERKNERCQIKTNPLRDKHLHTKATKHEKQEKKQAWEVFGHQQKPISKQY
jgi:hypothetical protein